MQAALIVTADSEAERGSDFAAFFMQAQGDMRRQIGPREQRFHVSDVTLGALFFLCVDFHEFGV